MNSCEAGTVLADRPTDRYKCPSLSPPPGLGHTLARRAAFLLQVDEVDLAIRDIKIAFELGCLGSELLDFLSWFRRARCYCGRRCQTYAFSPVGFLRTAKVCLIPVLAKA